MPTSKSFLLDVNCWLAAAAQRHEHHVRAKAWMDSAEGRIGFCRVTQMGFLRLVTNPKVMGPDVLTPSDAWIAYDRFRSDSRVVFVEEPTNLENLWRDIANDESFSRNRWTDSYLLAFARAANLWLVTFDGGFRGRTDVEVELLTSGAAAQ